MMWLMVVMVLLMWRRHYNIKRFLWWLKVIISWDEKWIWKINNNNNNNNNHKNGDDDDGDEDGDDDEGNYNLEAMVMIV